MPHAKINSTWIKDLNIKLKLYDTQKISQRSKLHECEFGNDFLDITPKVHVKTTATKNRQMRPQQTSQFLCGEGNDQ